MKVIKPLLVGFSCRPYKRQGNRLALTSFLSFSFTRPNDLLTDPEMWRVLQPYLPLDSPWDEGVPKDRGEVLVTGTCHAAGGVPVTHRRVSLTAGPVAKALDVWGNRSWIRQRGILQKGPAEPFVAMPINYAASFGGAGFEANPFGKGFLDPPDGSPRPLPNVEAVDQPILSPDDRPDPAGFGPLGMMWTGRRSKVGKYRTGEIDSREPPALPQDSDWTFFNQAPADQWVSGMWQGGEEFSLSGFHPDEETLRGRLPRIRIRAFLTFVSERIVEAEMKAETLWLFPDIAIGVLIYRGSASISTDDTSEIRTILVGSEDFGENRSQDHYLEAQSRRISQDKKDLSRFSDVPLLPASLAHDPRANLLDVEYQRQAKLAEGKTPIPNHVFKMLDAAKERIKKSIDPVLKTLPPDSPESPVNFSDPMREMVEGKLQQVDAIRKAFENPPSSGEEIGKMSESAKVKLEEGRKKAFESAKGALEKMPPGSLEDLGVSREELIAQAQEKFFGKAAAMQAPKKRPPSIDEMVNREKILAKLTSEKEKSASRAGGSPENEVFDDVLQKTLDSSLEEVSEKIEKLRAALPPAKTSGITRILHSFAPPEPDPDRSEDLRRTVLDELPRGVGFKDRDLRGADLSGLNLSGADFSEADLMGANFSGSNLTDANFTGAWIAHSNFSRSFLDRTNFTGASLACADLSETRGTRTLYRGSYLTGAVLISSSVVEGDFTGADLFDVLFFRSALHRAKFQGAKFLRVGHLPVPHPKGLAATNDKMARLPFEEVEFTGSDLTKAVFMKGDFVRSDFSKCILDKTTFLECTGTELRFDEARLHRTSFPKSTEFARSSFLKADLSGANLRGLNLEGSDFRGAILSATDASESLLRGANLSGVSARKGRFMKSDLRFADCRGGDFMQAIFLKADLRNTDFSKSSLFKAGFTGATIDSTTLWDHALIGKTTLSQEGPR